MGIASLFTLIGCYSARPDVVEYPRTASYAIAPNTETVLKHVIDPLAKMHPGQSGFHLITNGEEALALRLAMIQSAERSIDIQYYSVQNDRTGKLLLESLLRAADRGVRVRMLIDDIAFKASDDIWPMLNSHKNIELRIFNPFVTHDQSIFSRAISMMTDLDRFSRRMHNKVFIVDNQASITGGRNLGDSYFDASQEFNFRDADILTLGPLTARLSKSFDAYWNDDQAYPISAINPPTHTPQEVKEMREELEQHWQEAVSEKKGLPEAPLDEQLRNKKLSLIWAKAELAADSPDKIEQPREETVSKPASRLERLANNAQEEFIIVTPYIVPGEEGVAWIKGLLNRGIKIRVLTNSLASTDVIAVHAGYRRYREQLIEDGVDIYELKPLPGRAPRPRKPIGHFASASRASLHTKLYIIDRKDVLIGTFNLDPRSIELNTEIALVIHSPELAQKLVEIFEKATAPSSSYHVLIKPESHDIEWVAEEKGEEKHYTHEPKAGFWRNVKMHLLALLPFEDQL